VVEIDYLNNIIMLPKLEKTIIRANNEDFIAHFKFEGDENYKMSWSGTVAEIQIFDDGTWMYKSKVSSDFTDNLKDARIWFRWSFCWRGAWEGRVYFMDTEYWCEEMETIAEIWKQIERIVKNKIKSDNPDYGAFDD
jgi:hypothetical protein